MNWKSFAHTLRRSYALAWAVLLVGLTLTSSIAFNLHKSVRATEVARFERAVWQTTGVLQERLQKYELALSGVADFIASRNAISQPEWRFRIQMLAQEQNYPGLLEAGFAELEPAATDTAPAKLAAFSPTSAPSPAPAFRVIHGWARPPSAMDGVDRKFLNDPKQAATAWQSVLASSATLGDLRQLSAEVGGKPATGFTIFIPVYRLGMELPSTNAAVVAEAETAAHRARYARGVVFGATEPRIMLDRLFGTAPREINFEIFGDTFPATTNWWDAAGPGPATLKPQFRPYLKTNFPIQVLNRTWSMSFYTTPLFEKESSRSPPWLILMLGTGLSLSVTLILLTQIHARVRQNAIARELRSACDELQQVQSERERVSRDLHDGAIQSLYLPQLTLGRCERLLNSNVMKSRELLGQIRSGIDGLIAELRRFLLRDDALPAEPVKFEHAHAVLQQLVQRLIKTESIKIRMTGNTLAPISLPAAQLGHLKQIAQEAMSNSLRHAQARTLSLDLSASDSAIQLTVVDNGRGFDPQQHAGSGNGLANMQARAAHLGGTLKIDSSPGHGTSVTLTFPAIPIPESRHEEAKLHQVADR